MTNTANAWIELSRKSMISKYGRGIDKVRFQLPNGKISEFYLKNEKSSAGILAITSDNKIILVKQYRPGPKEILCELPGGFVDIKSNPEETIRSELSQETGYVGDIEYVGSCIDDAYSNLIRYCFIAKNCTRVAEQNLDKNENIEIVLFTLDEFRKHLRKGKLTDVEIGYLGLDHLGLL